MNAPRTAAVAIAFAASLAAGSPSPSRAASPGAARPPEPSRLWLTVRGALVFSDTLTLNQRDEFFDEETRLETTDDTTPGFGVGAHWRASRFDLGAFAESFGSGRFERLATTARIGSQTRFVGTFRWRFVDEGWGGLYIRFSPGLVIYELSDPLRFELTKLVPATTDFEEVEERVFGFTFGFDMGLHFYLGRRTAFFLELGTATGSATVLEEPDEIDYLRTRGLFTAGFEWQAR